jgi:Lectin C-type domain
MLSRARGALAALIFGSIAGWVLLSVPGCAVNRSGLSLAGGGGASAGAGGSKGGAAGAAGGHAGTAGGAPGIVGTAGTVGTGGAVGAAGTFGAGGTDATGSAGTSGGTAATGGADATGGGGTIGAAGVDGQAGTTGNGGGGQTGGTGGAGGRMHGGGGNSGHPDCSPFPSGGSTTLSSDGLQHCYWTHGDPLLWTDAESTCEGEGGTLATILSAQENTFITQLAGQNQLSQGLNAVWLGASDGKASSDTSGPGTYTWVTGEAWGYQPWHPGQPDGSCNPCDAVDGCQCDHWLAFTADGTWYDRSESVPRPYVCEATAR